MNMDPNMTNTKENKKQYIKIYNLYSYLYKYEVWVLGRREKDANSQTDIRQVTFTDRYKYKYRFDTYKQNKKQNI